MKKITVTPRIFKGIVKRRAHIDMLIWFKRTVYTYTQNAYQMKQHEFTEGLQYKQSKRIINKKRNMLKKTKEKMEKSLKKFEAMLERKRLMIEENKKKYKWN